jgi:heme/copper-type cytochrome/quinol oxidase subunit 3
MSNADAQAVGHGADEAAEHFERSRLGMWLFLGSEIMMFGAFIACYIVLRMAMPTDVVEASKKELSVPIATFNTAVLILSSYTIVRAVNAVSKGNKAHAEDMMVATAALGLLFLVVKGFEYNAKFAHGIGPDTNVFYGCYFLMTGFHGFHVLVGVVAILWGAFYVKRTSPQRYAYVENLALYWHLVDIIWIFLFPIVYLL